MADKRQRTELVGVRMTPAELAKIVELAGSRSAVAAFMRKAALEGLRGERERIAARIGVWPYMACGCGETLQPGVTHTHSQGRWPAGERHA